MSGDKKDKVKQVWNRVGILALQWMRENRPDLIPKLRDQVYKDLGIKPVPYKSKQGNASRSLAKALAEEKKDELA